MSVAGAISAQHLLRGAPASTVTSGVEQAAYWPKGFKMLFDFGFAAGGGAGGLSIRSLMSTCVSSAALVDPACFLVGALGLAASARAGLAGLVVG